MKLSKLLEISPALVALNATKLPVKAAYRIAKAINMINGEIKHYDEQRLKLAQELGTLSEDGQSYRFNEVNSKEFSEQMNALLSEEVDLALPTISEAELGDHASIEPQHLMALVDVLLVG